MADEVEFGGTTVDSGSVVSATSRVGIAERFRECATSKEVADIDSGRAEGIVSSRDRSMEVNSGSFAVYNCTISSTADGVSTIESFIEHATS